MHPLRSVDELAGRLTEVTVRPAGAVNVPATANLDDGGFRPVAELAATYAGVHEGAEVAAYCGSGISAHA